MSSISKTLVEELQNFKAMEQQAYTEIKAEDVSRPVNPEFSEEDDDEAFWSTL